MDSSPSQEQNSETVRPPREPQRHALSNNWRARGEAPSSDAKEPSRTSHQVSSPSPANNRPTSDWRGKQDRTISSPVSPGRGGRGAWRSQDSPHQQDSSSSSAPARRRVNHVATDNVASGHRQTPPASGSLLEDSDALTEGRRIYLGNILYHVRPEQITEALQEQGFGEDDVDQIHISVDPVTGRNPGYCFVEFETKETAETALERMVGVLILGRPLKTGPCKPKAWQSRDKQARQYRPTFERWGNWNSDGSRGVQVSGQGPIGAEEHLIEVVQKEQRYRVFVGGLGKMINQAENDKELRAIFDGFKVAAVSKRITPSEVTRAKPGKHHYAFVDLEDEAEAMKAIKSLDGRQWNGGRLKVRVPVDLPEKIAKRGTRYGTTPGTNDNE